MQYAVVNLGTQHVHDGQAHVAQIWDETSDDLLTEELDNSELTRKRLGNNDALPELYRLR